LDSIKIAVEQPTAGMPDALNALPLLHEIRHALTRLFEKGEPTTIDLTSIPFGPGDKDQLLEVLGSGEVDASVDAMGSTKVRETAYPGVWLVEYFSPTGEPLTTHIEVARCPSVILTPEQDLADAALALQARLEG
jgi:hydrogenase-1 operon protein HyaF